LIKSVVRIRFESEERRGEQAERGTRGNSPKAGQRMKPRMRFNVKKGATFETQKLQDVVAAGNEKIEQHWDGDDVDQRSKLKEARQNKPGKKIENKVDGATSGGREKRLLQNILQHLSATARCAQYLTTSIRCILLKEDSNCSRLIAFALHQTFNRDSSLDIRR
jgi:hypothetical protein